MKKSVQLTPKMWKGSLMLLSFLLLAACMQYDESLAPMNRVTSVSDLAVIESMEPGMVAAMTKKVFTAHLNSSNEVSSMPIESQGQGEAIFTLNEDETALHFKLIVANIEDVTQAHIHCGAAGANGPPVVFLFGFDADGETVNGTLAEGTITAANVIPRPTCASGSVTTFADLVELIRTGNAYVNAHTPTYPGGEIRGQIK